MVQLEHLFGFVCPNNNFVLTLPVSRMKIRVVGQSSANDVVSWLKSEGEARCSSYGTLAKMQSRIGKWD